MARIGPKKGVESAPRSTGQEPLKSGTGKPSTGPVGQKQDSFTTTSPNPIQAEQTPKGNPLFTNGYGQYIPDFLKENPQSLTTLAEKLPPVKWPKPKKMTVDEQKREIWAIAAAMYKLPSQIIKKSPPLQEVSAALDKIYSSIKFLAPHFKPDYSNEIHSEKMRLWLTTVEMIHGGIGMLPHNKKPDYNQRMINALKDIPNEGREDMVCTMLRLLSSEKKARLVKAFEALLTPGQNLDPEKFTFEDATDAFPVMFELSLSVTFVDNVLKSRGNAHGLNGTIQHNDGERFRTIPAPIRSDIEIHRITRLPKKPQKISAAAKEAAKKQLESRMQINEDNTRLQNAEALLMLSLQAQSNDLDQNYILRAVDALNILDVDEVFKWVGKKGFETSIENVPNSGTEWLDQMAKTISSARAEMFERQMETVIGGGVLWDLELTRRWVNFQKQFEMRIKAIPFKIDHGYEVTDQEKELYIRYFRDGSIPPIEDYYDKEQWMKAETEKLFGNGDGTYGKILFQKAEKYWRERIAALPSFYEEIPQNVREELKALPPYSEIPGMFRGVTTAQNWSEVYQTMGKMNKNPYTSLFTLQQTMRALWYKEYIPWLGKTLNNATIGPLDIKTLPQASGFTEIAFGERDLEIPIKPRLLAEFNAKMGQNIKATFAFMENDESSNKWALFTGGMLAAIGAIWMAGEFYAATLSLEMGLGLKTAELGTLGNWGLRILTAGIELNASTLGFTVGNTIALTPLTGLPTSKEFLTNYWETLKTFFWLEVAGWGLGRFMGFNRGMEAVGITEGIDRAFESGRGLRGAFQRVRALRALQGEFEYFGTASGILYQAANFVLVVDILMSCDCKTGSVKADGNPMGEGEYDRILDALKLGASLFVIIMGARTLNIRGEGFRKAQREWINTELFKAHDAILSNGAKFEGLKASWGKSARENNGKFHPIARLRDCMELSGETLKAYAQKTSLISEAVAGEHVVINPEGNYVLAQSGRAGRADLPLHEGEKFQLVGEGEKQTRNMEAIYRIMTDMFNIAAKGELGRDGILKIPMNQALEASAEAQRFNEVYGAKVHVQLLKPNGYNGYRFRFRRTDNNELFMKHLLFTAEPPLRPTGRPEDIELLPLGLPSGLGF